MIPADRQRNYLQSALYVLIAAILATILLNRLFTAAEYAERAAMQVSVSNLQTSLYARLALLVLKGDVAAIPELETRSPFITAQMASSATYAGEFPGTAPQTVGDGTWYFDTLRNELVYRVRYASHFITDGERGEKSEIRFRVHVVRATSGAYRGVELRPVAPFQWDPGA